MVTSLENKSFITQDSGPNNDRFVYLKDVEQIIKEEYITINQAMAYAILSCKNLDLITNSIDESTFMEEFMDQVQKNGPEDAERKWTSNE